jgi:hypothetical protein
MQPIGKILILAGGIMLLLGAILVWWDKVPFLGKLPGDISIRKDNIQFHFPITTSLILSVLASLVLWAISQFKGR